MRDSPIKTLSAKQIRAISADSGHRAKALSLTPVDWSRPFVHEHFTPLYYTSYYKRLSVEHRLRFNQLWAIKINEQFMMLERDIADRLLTKLLRHPAVAQHSDLCACVGQMMREEELHYGMFRDLNRLCLPEVYSRGDHHFAKLGLCERVAISVATSMPHHLTFLLWFILAVEEYSVAISRSMMKSHQTETLGSLEPNFIRVHEEHVKDEWRHLHLDALLIKACASTSRKLSLWTNARLFDSLMGWVATPSSSLNVIQHWLSEQPELRPIEKQLITDVMALGCDDAYQYSLFNRSMMPHTFAQLDAQPEFASLDRVLKGDRRRA